MKKFLLWFLAFFITIGAAYYQRKTGPTYPKRAEVPINDSVFDVRLVRSIGLDEKPEVMLAISDTNLEARLYYKRLNTDDNYSISDFRYKVSPVKSFLMNKIFGVYEEKGFFAEIPMQPPAGKLQYYIEVTDSKGTFFLYKDDPVIIRFKGSVPGYILAPHVLLMFLAMLFSTLAGLMSLIKFPKYKKYSLWTLITLFLGGMILGPVVQKYAFGELWTGVPFGWDLTDNKTLIAFIFWILAVVMNVKREKPIFTALAAFVLLLVYSVPHSLFGSELDYSTGEVTQGLILIFSLKIFKKA